MSAASARTPAPRLGTSRADPDRSAPLLYVDSDGTVLTGLTRLGLGETTTTIRGIPMSASGNKAAAQAAYQAFSSGDLEGALRDMADDIEWVVPGDSTISGTYRGKGEVAQFFATLASKSFRTEPEHFIAEGEHVVVLTRTTSEGGESADQADVLTFRDGKVIRFQSASDTALLEAVWGRK